MATAVRAMTRTGVSWGRDAWLSALAMASTILPLGSSASGTGLPPLLIWYRAQVMYSVAVLQ